MEKIDISHESYFITQKMSDKRVVQALHIPTKLFLISLIWRFFKSMPITLSNTLYFFAMQKVLTFFQQKNNSVFVIFTF